MGICGMSMAGGFGMDTLRGDVVGRSSWGRRIGHRLESSWVQVCENVAQGGCGCCPFLDFLVERVYCCQLVFARYVKIVV